MRRIPDPALDAGQAYLEFPEVAADHLAGFARDAASLDAWLDEWVYGLANHAEYVEKMGAQLWDSLRPEPALSGEVDYGRYA